MRKFLLCLLTAPLLFQVATAQDYVVFKRHDPKKDPNLNPFVNLKINPDSNMMINPAYNWNNNPLHSSDVNPSQNGSINPIA